MTRLIYWYPIMFSAIGVGIHFFGTLRLFQLEVHFEKKPFMLPILRQIGQRIDDVVHAAQNLRLIIANFYS